MSHTPGPWRVLPAEVTSGWGLCVGSDRVIVAQIKGPKNAEKTANACLVAAAPELLEALRGMLREHDAITIAAGGKPGVTDRWPERAAAARAVIAKATGTQV